MTEAEVLIRKVVKEMIEDGSIRIEVDVQVTKEGSDCFGNSVGAVSEVDVEVYLDYGEDK